jgi:hypothetical protein
MQAAETSRTLVFDAVIAALAASLLLAPEYSTDRDCHGYGVRTAAWQKNLINVTLPRRWAEFPPC